jgi:hypothetical protein
MAQIVDSIVKTCLQFGHDYGPWVAGSILVFVVGSLALRILAIVLPRGGPKQGK